MAMIDIKNPADVSTASVVSLGLLGGWLTARETGIRPLGGAVLAAAGGWAMRSWWTKTDPLTTAGLTALYVGAFGASHPLATKIGSWPAVLGVTAVAGSAACVLSDLK
ncbi:hypothetical protein [Corynebacterium sp.]|uniref:hypothetical protein n=1 Tax=Corynebacterium sp. TaxID=1720 RepID=UPI0026DF5709|nr:hypothetical protein [Corynebacterium sp.]MDO5511867.1 hypothetical protein [Corynebacterium sp.]